MAGKPSRGAEIEELKRELARITAERDRFQSQLAAIDPKYLLKDKPEPVKGYSAHILARVLALGNMGKSQQAWIAEFGITQATWVEWKNQYPELLDAVDKALSAALAWWQERARKAQENGNTKFPLSVYNKRTSEIQEEQGEFVKDTGLGDASKLVLLDLRTSVAGSGEVQDAGAAS